MSGLEEIQERVNDVLALADYIADEMDFRGHPATIRVSRAVDYLKLASMVLKHPELIGLRELAGFIEKNLDSKQEETPT